MRFSLLAGLAAVAVLQTACHASAAPPRHKEHAHARRSSAAGCTSVMRRGHGLQRFVASLRRGAVGCLPPGTYTAQKLTFSRSGTADARIVLRSQNAARPATIRGTIWIRDVANYVTVENLRVVGASAQLPAVIINGDHSIWDRDDVSNPPTGTELGGICFSLGQLDRWGYAGSTTIENSLIHDCGRSTNTNQGIYVQATSGRTLIRNNWIFRNGDRGVQLYPAARNVVVTHNVIDGNGSGVIFSGDGRNVSSDNTVALNIISNSRLRWNVESSFPSGAVGANNLVARNCVWASGEDRFYNSHGGLAPPVGYVVRGNNVVQRPRFGDAPAGDLRLMPGSGCRGFGLTTARIPGPSGTVVAGR